MTRVLLPELGEGIEKATVACWHYRIGDAVKEDDDIVELVTDKASFNVPATASGVIREIRFQDGEEANIGDVLAVIETIMK